MMNLAKYGMILAKKTEKLLFTEIMDKLYIELSDSFCNFHNLAFVLLLGAMHFYSFRKQFHEATLEAYT
jgi:hypothetical protein